MLFQIGLVTVDSPDGLNATGTSEEFGADMPSNPSSARSSRGSSSAPRITGSR